MCMAELLHRRFYIWALSARSVCDQRHSKINLRAYSGYLEQRLKTNLEEGILPMKKRDHTVLIQAALTERVLFSVSFSVINHLDLSFKNIILDTQYNYSMYFYSYSV